MAWVAQLQEFFKEVRVEFWKISWPTRNELRDSTVVVIATVILLTTFVFVVDRILQVGLKVLLR